MKIRQKAFTLIEILVIITIIGVLLSLWGLSINANRIETRDLRRLKDISELRSAMELMKNEIGSYDRAYCNLTYVSLCSQNSNSELLKYLPGLANLNDPKETQIACTLDNCDKSCNYSFVKLDIDDYAVIFNLEKGVNNYTQGCYILNSQGIIKR